jgi:hypothetical protein
MHEEQDRITNAIRRLREGVRWRPEKDVQHLAKRIELGHLPAEATLVEYEALIIRVVNTPHAESVLCILKYQRGQLFPHQQGKSDNRQPFERLRQLFIIPSQSSQPRRPALTALNDPAPWPQHKAALGLRELDHVQCHVLGLGLLRRLLPRGGLLHKCQLHRIACGLLDWFGQYRSLMTVLLVGRGHPQGQQMSQGVHRQVHFRAASAFGWITTRSRATLRGRLQGSTLQDCRRWLGRSPVGHPQQFTQVDPPGVQHPGLEPPLALLLDGVPRRHIMGHQAPRCPRADNPPKPIINFAPAVFALRGVFGHEGQIGGYKGPFVIPDVAGVRFSFHSPSVSAMDQSASHALIHQRSIYVTLAMKMKTYRWKGD